MYCKCGCGQLTTVAKRNYKDYGWKKGVPIDYIKGHHSKSKEPFPVVDGLKQCTVCGEIKDVSDFHNQKNFTKLRANCKDCERERRLKMVATRKNLVDGIKEERGCCFCCVAEACVLDFHHINPSEKSRDVAEMVKNVANIEKILAEINKCVVICSNCHRRLHAGKISLVL